MGAPRLVLVFSLMVSRVRVAAAESMPLLLECARVRGPEYLTQMWHFMCDALIKAIGTEPDSDVLSEIMHSFAKVAQHHCLFVNVNVEALPGLTHGSLCVRSVHRVDGRRVSEQ